MPTTTHARRPAHTAPLTALLCAALAVALSPGRAAAGEAEDWPGWRGPRGDGSSLEVNLPTQWSDTENVAWKVAVPGTGHSSPVVLGDKVFLTSALEDRQERVLICLDRRDGTKLWESTVLSAPLEGKHQLNSYASSTPATDGERLYISFLEQPNIRLICFDLDGKEVWRKSPGTFSSIHGFCSSPLIYEDLVILNCDQDADAWIVAYDKATGEERWRTDRPNKTRSYCTPLVIEAAGKTQMVLSGSKSVASYDPATGKQHWVIDGPTEQFVASLVYTQGILFMTGGYPELHVLGIDPGGSGNVTASHVKWRDHRGVSYVPSPVAHDRWFFIVADNGIASCFEATTGKVKWKERLGRRHSASAVYADGHVYFLDDDGETHVVRAGPEFELVSNNPLGEAAFASPAVSRGQVFIRTANHLWCIGRPPAAGAPAAAAP
jgi:outer membrane protein assembly factor BamB